MNLNGITAVRRPGRQAERKQGMGIIVVVVMMGVIAALLVANTRILARFNETIHLLENKQQQKYGNPPAHLPADPETPRAPETVPAEP